METATLTQTRTFQWRTLLSLAALANLAVLAYMGFTNGDSLALMLTLIIVAGLALTRLRSGALGAILLGLVSADIMVWTISGAVNNFLHGEQGLTVLLPSMLGIISLTTLVAAIGAVVNRSRITEYSRGAAVVGSVSLGLLVLAGLASFLVRTPGSQLSQGAPITLGSKNMVFSNTELHSEHGEVTLTLANEDLWWHTFTIDELDVDLQVPMGAERTITFDAPPGEYRFYCAIPGHEAIGMVGTLKVGE